MNLACRTRSSRSKYRNREARTRCRQSQVSCRTTRPFATQIGRSSVRCGPTLVSFLQNKAKKHQRFHGPPAETVSHLTAANELAIRRALETAGVEFIDENGGGPGVRLRKQHVKKG